LAFRLELTDEVRNDVDSFATALRRRWDYRLYELVEDPLRPREGVGFSILVTTNRFGDRFMSFVADELPFVIQYDVYLWPDDEENVVKFEGKVRIWRLAPL
jgi:hypothetical protein